MTELFGKDSAICVESAEHIVRLSLLTMTNPNQMREVLLFACSKMAVGVVGCGEVVVYHTSPGRPTDIGINNILFQASIYKI